VRVLITRPRPAATALAARLAALGHAALVEPLLTITEDPDARRRLAGALDGVQALLFTSSNGVASFAGASGRRDIRVFAVGDGTASAARQAGFTEVESAQGDVAALAKLVTAKLAPGAGALLHASGHKVAGDLAGRLGRLGFTVRSVPLYRATPPEALSVPTVRALRGGEVDAALFFSPRTAATFVRLARAAEVERSCAGMAGVALSVAVAAELEGLGWRHVLVADAPTEAAVLTALDGLAAELRKSGALHP
jgi:uroporphyrinogen-III synthase